MILITQALRDARPADSLMTAVNLRSCCNGSECVWGHAPVIEDCGVCWTAQVSFWESLALPQTDVCAGEQWRKRCAVWCVIPLKNEKRLTADAQQLSQTVVLQLSHKIIIYYYNSPQHFFPSIACVSHLQTFNPFLILTQSPFIHLDSFPHHRGHFVYLFNVCLHLLHKHNKQQHTIILCIRTVKTIYSFLLCVYLGLTLVCCSLSWVTIVGSSLLLAIRRRNTCSLYLLMISSSADWCSSSDVRSSAEREKHLKQTYGTRQQTSQTQQNTPVFSCCSSRIWRFSCWMPMTSVERGRCLATWFSTSISSWYCRHTG